MYTQRTYLGNFRGDILVKCPRCTDCAHLTERHDARGYLAGHRLICSNCGLSRTWGAMTRWQPAVHPARHPELDLWLATTCGREVLWAYNQEHLEFLTGFIRAKIRPKARIALFGGNTRSLETCLPRWMINRGSRSRVLQGLEILHDKVSRLHN